MWCLRRQQAEMRRHTVERPRRRPLDQTRCGSHTASTSNWQINKRENTEHISIGGHDSSLVHRTDWKILDYWRHQLLHSNRMKFTAHWWYNSTWINSILSKNESDFKCRRVNSLVFFMSGFFFGEIYNFFSADGWVCCGREKRFVSRTCQWKQQQRCGLAMVTISRTPGKIAFCHFDLNNHQASGCCCCCCCRNS